MESKGRIQWKRSKAIHGRIDRENMNNQGGIYGNGGNGAGFDNSI